VVSLLRLDYTRNSHRSEIISHFRPGTGPVRSGVAWCGPVRLIVAPPESHTRNLHYLSCIMVPDLSGYFGTRNVHGIEHGLLLPSFWYEILVPVTWTEIVCHGPYACDTPSRNLYQKLVQVFVLYHKLARVSVSLVQVFLVQVSCTQ